MIAILGLRVSLSVIRGLTADARLLDVKTAISLFCQFRICIPFLDHVMESFLQISRLSQVMVHQLQLLPITHGTELPLQKFRDSRHALKLCPTRVSIYRDYMRRAIVLLLLGWGYKHLLDLRSKLQFFGFCLELELPLVMQSFFFSLHPHLVSLKRLLFRCFFLPVKIVR